MIRRPLLILGIGAAASASLAVVGAPLLAGFFTPAEVGRYAVLLATVGMLANAAPLKQEDAIAATPREDRPVAFALAFALGALVTFAAAPLIVWLAHARLGLGTTWALLVAPMAFASMGLRLASQWFLVERGFVIVGAIRIGREGLPLAIQVLLGAAFGYGTAELLVAGATFGWAVSLIPLLVLLASTSRARFRGIGPARLWCCWGANRDFTRFGFPGHLVEQVNYFGPEFLLGILGGPGLAGIYALSIRAVRMPLQIVGQAAQEYLLSHLANRRGPASARNLERGFLLLITVFAAIVLLLVAVAETLVGWLFAETWHGMVEVIRRIAPWMFLLALSWVSLAVFQVRRRQKALLVFRILALVATVPPLVLLVPTGDGLHAIAVMSLGLAGVRWGMVCYGLAVEAGRGTAWRMGAASALAAGLIAAVAFGGL